MKMIHSYESCSLPGQAPVSLRHLRLKGTKLEFPMMFLKAHLSVNQQTREDLLRKLLNRKTSFQSYKAEILKLGQLPNKKDQSPSLMKTSTPIKQNSIKPRESPSISIIQSETPPLKLTNEGSEQNLLKRKVGERNSDLESPKKRPTLVKKQNFSFTDDILSKDCLVLIGELKGDVDEYDLGTQAVRAMGEHFKGEYSNSILGVFFR